MNRWLPLLLVVIHLGCSSATVPSAQGDGGLTSDGGGDGANPDDAAKGLPIDNKTWTGIYAAYFGPNSIGHCGNAGCHATLRRGFVCGTKAGCYQSLVANHFVGTDAALQALVDPQASVLSWIDGSGAMPADQPSTPNPTATADLKAWIAAGTPDN